MDTCSPEQRSKIMSRIRSKDSRPEKLVRKLVFALGYRYRLHVRDVPGCPDIVFRPRGKVIFVHGCFWHQHKNCGVAHIPKTRRDFWEPKLEGNCRRDERIRKELNAAGWKVLTLWECELKDSDRLNARLMRFLGALS